MGRVIELQAWRQGRAPRSEDPAVLRLELAVARLDRLIGEVNGGRRGTGIDIETELLAITGALSMGLLEEAAARAQGLAERLEGLARHGT